MINVASFVAILGAATSQISYTASKGAVLALSRELAGATCRALTALAQDGPVLYCLISATAQSLA